MNLYVYLLIFELYLLMPLLAEVCPTPLGMKLEDEKSGRDQQTLRCFCAGTTCTDVSAMGSHSGLFGDSSLPLAVWLSELRHVRPVTCLDKCLGFLRCFVGSDSQKSDLFVK